MSDVMIKGEPRMMQNCTHKQLILGQQVRGHTFPGTNGFWVVFFLVTSHQKHTLTVPCSQFIHSSIHWQTDFSSRSEHSEQLADFAKWHGVNQCNWGLLTSSTDNCLETTVFKQKLPIQTASWPDSHERASETKAPHNHRLLSFTCQINCASPAVEVAAPSEAAAMRCSFMSWQRNLFFYLPPELACHIYRSRLLSCPSVASARL